MCGRREAGIGGGTRIAILLLLLALALPSLAGDAGVPLMKVFTADDYGAHSQNWSVLQGADGLIYAGNGSGLLQFDGERWKRYPTPHETRVRRMVDAAPGHMLVATTDDLLEVEVANSHGLHPSMHSLTAAWPEALRGFGETMGLARIAFGTLVQASHRVILIQPDGGLKHWDSEAGFQQSFAIGDDWYVLDRARGLLRLTSSDTAAAEIPLAADGARLAQDQLSFMLRLRDGSILLASRKLGLLRYRDGRLQPWKTAIDDWIRDQIVVPGIELSDGSLVLGSLRAGLARIDSDGQLLQFLDERDGLPSNSVYALATDNQGGLWIALDGGIARVAWPHPLTRFDRRQGLATVWGIGRHQDRLVLSTRLGLLLGTATERGRPLQFEHAPGQPTQAWETWSVDDDLWIAGSDGVWRIRNASAPVAAWQSERIHDERFAYSLLGDARHADTLFAATSQGVIRITDIRSAQPQVHVILGYTGEARQLAQDQDGTLWAGTPNGRLLRLSANDETFEVLDASTGVPAGMTWPAIVSGRLLVGTSAGVFARHDDQFATATEFKGCANVARLRQTSAATLWIACNGNAVAAQRAGNGQWNDDAGKLRGLRNESIYAFFADADGSTWIGRERDLIRYDAKTEPPTWPKVLPRLRAAYGDIGDGGVEPLDLSAGADAWPVGMRQLHLQFALPVFGLSRPVRYYAHLEGVDSERLWGLGAAQRDYSNLGGGRYRFNLSVEAPELVEQGNLSADYVFAIAKPWYRQWWAMLLWWLWVAAAIWLLALGIASWRSRVLIERNRVLALRVLEQTRDLQLQTEQLKAADVAKTRFFAGVAHDVRSPLMLILEPLQDVLRGVFGTLPHPATDQLQRVEANARRLNRLVESLLDLHSIEAGQRRLHPSAHDAKLFVDGVLAHFSGWADEHGIVIDLDTRQLHGLTWFDAQAIEQVLFNILGNALKHAPGASQIEVTLAGGGDEPCRILVRDRGPGFAADVLARVFEHYVRGDRARLQRTPGSGLGLALCRELIEAHGGRIAARNATAGGAEIEFELPACAAAQASAREPDSAPALHATAAPADALDVLDGVGADRTTVLLVDDNEELRAFLADRLRADYRVLEASDGRQALALAKQSLPDVIVSDVQMPELDGLALTRALRADAETGAIPILLMAAHGALDERIAGLETGASDFLAKPFHVSEMIARISALIFAQRQLRTRLLADGIQLTPNNAAVAEPEFLQRVRAAVAARLDDSRFGVSELAALLHIERSTLFKRLKALGVESPVQLIRNQRLDAAADLLVRRQGQVTEIAYACGFESLSHFSRVFRERFGKTPSEYAAG